ncbi:hypothetical protein CHS0354_014979 [Potamilus streckersoni]|uniref:Sulphur transport domain-containing protein n=1 Tax=Potamilus streckersoni TaxID=2493646 RepID=A0AAE0SIT9_9BIVA|nr:hypothetical protein CHS0354_014979 [Potamilus streckersoni]
MSEKGSFQNGNKVSDSSSTGSSTDGSCTKLKMQDDTKDEKQTMSMPVVVVKLSICFITGIVFGFALEKGRVFEPKSIRDQMVFKSFIMLKMFLAATGTGHIVFGLLSAIPATKSYFVAVSDEFVSCFKEKGILTSMIGPFVLGIGMTLSGACPGMVLAQVGAWSTNSIFTLIGCLFGALTYGMIGPFISKIARPKKCLENHQVHSTLKWPFIAIALPMGLLIGAVVVILEIFWDWQKDLSNLNPNRTRLHDDNIFVAVAWRPSISGIIIGLLQLPIVFAVKDTLGGSSSYVTVVSQWLVTKNIQEIFPYLEKKRTGVGNWWQVFYVSGAILGGAISALLSNTMATAHGPSIPAALFGGIIMLWGARLAAGCTSGHGLSGLGLLAWLSFLAVPCMFAGAIGTGFAMQATGALDDYMQYTLQT